MEGGPGSQGDEVHNYQKEGNGEQILGLRMVRGGVLDDVGDEGVSHGMLLADACNLASWVYMWLAGHSEAKVLHSDLDGDQILLPETLHVELGHCILVLEDGRQELAHGTLVLEICRQVLAHGTLVLVVCKQVLAHGILVLVVCRPVLAHGILVLVDYR